MGMFETTGRLEAGTERKDNTLRKLERMKTALSHREPDRVPISDFFWGGFIRRWRQELDLPADKTTQEWWAECMPCQEPLKNRKKGEWWAGMTEVFHCD